jgi:2-methylisocitrate lyase-like PEP mutase family enzyme
VSDPLNARLRARVFSGSVPLLLPGTPNALIARMLEDANAEAVYVSGAGVSNAYLGMPDSGFLTLPELAQHVTTIREATDVPVVVDADTGFGNALNAWRTVRMLERAGANAIQLEDQVTPKRCGHFDGKATISTGEMLGKIGAALDARTDPDLLIIARTDALDEYGIAEACERANAYRQAGADIVFVEAPGSLDDVRRIPKLASGPHVINMVEGGRTPIVPLADLADFGYSVVLYANTALRGAMMGAKHVIDHLLRHGDSIGVGDDITEWNDRQAAVRKEYFDNMSLRYGQ